MKKAILPLAFLLGISGASAATPSDRAWKDCVSDNAAASIRGCTQVLARGTRESATIRGSAHLNRGLEHFGAGRTREALLDYQAASALRPNWARPHIEMMFVYKKLDQPDLALAQVNEAIGLEPEIEGGYYHRADLLDDRGDIDGALADVTRAIRLDPASGSAHNLRGVLLNKKADFARAIVDFNASLRKGVQNAAVYNNRAFSYSHMGLFAAAIADYDYAIELAPDRATVINDRGVAYFKTGRMDLALADFERALRVDPSYRPARANRVEALLAKKDCQAAKQDLERLIAEDSTPQLLAMRGNCQGALT